MSREEKAIRGSGDPTELWIPKERLELKDRIAQTKLNKTKQSTGALPDSYLRNTDETEQGSHWKDLNSKNSLQSTKPAVRLGNTFTAGKKPPGRCGGVPPQQQRAEVRHPVSARLAAEKMDESARLRTSQIQRNERSSQGKLTSHGSCVTSVG